MAEEKDLQKAREVYATLCQAMDNLNWRYDKDEAELTIECGARGEDLPMKIIAKVDAERRLVKIFSHIPVTVPEDKRLDVAVAISTVNYGIVDGSFDYDIQGGNIFFRMTNSFFESTLGTEAFRYMILCTCATVDEYNDKFLMLAKGVISLEQFLQSQNQ